MNAAKVTLTATVVAAVFGLALSFGASPATAHCKGKHSGNPCNHIDQDQKSQTFEVELIEDGTIGAIITGVDCIGSSERKQVTHAIFPPVPDCEGLTILNDNPPLTLHLCQINLNHRFRPVLTVTMFFTSGQGVVGAALCPDAVYQGEFDASFEDPDVCKAGNTCVVIIDLPELTLKKSQQPDKGDEAGQFSLGNIVWTPVE